MTGNLPYMNAYGQISKILNKIKKAKTPDRFTYDFLSTKLAVKASSARPFIPLAKRIGLLNNDGSPTDLYTKFRNTDEMIAKKAIAAVIKKGYAELFARNEYANKLSVSELKGLIIEITGLDSDNQIVSNTVATFEALKKFASFEGEIPTEECQAEEEADVEEPYEIQENKPEFGLNLAYTINLVLPKTDDISVFNAIFKSLRENLLKK